MGSTEERRSRPQEEKEGVGKGGKEEGEGEGTDWIPAERRRLMEDLIWEKERGRTKKGARKSSEVMGRRRQQEKMMMIRLGQCPHSPRRTKIKKFSFPQCRVLFVPMLLILPSLPLGVPTFFFRAFSSSF